MFNLIKNEKIILAKRRHYIILVLQIAPFAFIILLLLAFSFLNYLIDLSLLQQGAYAVGLNIEGIKLHFLASLLAILIASFLWIIILLEFIFFFFDIWFLTNKRIVKTDIINLFHKKISTVSLKNIENIRASRKGLLAIIYKYGNIEIETAGNYENFKLSGIFNQEKFKNAIFNAIEDDEKSSHL